jgi:hypothetical protein
MRTDIARQGSTSLARVPRRTRRTIDHIDQVAQVGAAKVRSVQFVGHTALGAVAETVQVAGSLQRAVPEAAMSLALTADTITGTINGIVVRTGAQL